MDFFTGLCGAVFYGLIAWAFFYLAYQSLYDNPFFAFCVGMVALAFSAYAIGLLLWPSLESLLNAIRKKK